MILNFNVIGRFRSPDKLDQSMKKVNPLDYTKYTNEDVNDTITSLRRLKQVKFEWIYKYSSEF